MESSTFFPNPLNTPALMVLASQAENQEGARVPGQPRYSQQDKDGPQFTNPNYTMYRPGEPFPPPIYAPVHPFVRPTADRAAHSGIRIMNPVGTSAFRSVSTDSSESFHSAFSPTKRQMPEDLSHKNSFNSSMGENSDTRENMESRDLSMKDDRPASLNSIGYDTNSDSHSELDADRGTPDSEGRSLRTVGIKPISSFHDFGEDDILQIRKKLLEWYRKNKRDLPWRRNLTIANDNQRAYAVWVSEIMLQQTQVATVISYYNKWMEKWPSLQALAKTSLEEVNEMWSGLGYYSRGRRLHEGAKKVVEELNGEMPKIADSLLKDLPGVGKYTAGAIASIAYNQPTGLVDGNVIRVFSRLRCIGADSTSQHVIDTLWSHANVLVDPDHPGDFNQGLMELGATVCTPKAPECSKCPLQINCRAFQQVEHQKQKNAKKLSKADSKQTDLVDIECLADDCHLCIPASEQYDEGLGVTNYPRKGKKKAAREERTSVCVLCRKTKSSEKEYLISQRPEKGLLAGLWEFPSQVIETGCTDRVPYQTVLDKYGVQVQNTDKVVDVGEVVHIFSHIHQTYVVEGITANQSDVTEKDQSNMRWVTKQQFMEAAVSTAMKKVFKAYESSLAGKSKEKKTALKEKNTPDKGQRSISAFFKAAT